MGGTRARAGTPFVPGPKVMEAILERVDTEGRHTLSTVAKAWRDVDGDTRTCVRVFNCYGAKPSRLTRRFRNLRRIKIKGRPRADDFGLVAPEWGGFAAPWIREIVGAYPGLLCLHLKRMVVSDDDLRALAPLQGLEELILQDCRECFSTEGLRSVAQFRLLKVLSLRGSRVRAGGELQWLHDLALNNKVLEVLELDYLVEPVDVEDCPVDVDVEDLEKLAGSLKTLRVPIDVLLRQLKNVLRRTTGLRGLGAGSFDEDGGDLSICLPGSIISLSGLGNLPDEYVRHMEPVAAHLLELDLRAPLGLNEESYCQLLSWCRNLEELQLGVDVGDNVLSVVGRRCKKLKKLCLDRVSDDEEAKVTERGVLAVVEGCADLTFFLCYAVDMTNDVLGAIGRNCSKLRDFRFILVQKRKKLAEKTFDDGVRDLLRGCTNLERLCFYVRQGAGLTDLGLQHIGTYGQNLKWLLLGCVGSTAMGMKNLGPGVQGRGCRKLEKLELRDCTLSVQCIADIVVGMFPTDLGDPRQFRLRYLWFSDIRGVSSLEGLEKPNHVHVEVERPVPPGGNDGSVEHVLPIQQLFAYCSLDGARTDRPPTIQLL